MDDDELREIAKAASEEYEEALGSLDGLDDDQLDYLSRIDKVEDDELGVEHDDEPHLTDEEWEYVLALNGTTVLKEGEMVLPKDVTNKMRGTDG
jgi:hypothetical protein